MLNKKKNPKVRIFSILFTALFFFSILNYSFNPAADAAMATGKAKWVGNIWYDGNAPSRFADYWNQVTPENATKWASCEPQQGVYTFGTAQSMYNYCKSNGIPFKFHTLIWGGQYPSWVNNLSGASRKTEVENWIRTAGQNFPNADYVDVVNEAMPGHNPPSWRTDIGGDNGLYGTGWDWVVWSFEKARQYFPNSKLLINDYNVLCDNYSCIDTYITVINILKSRGLIDGIGCQSHGLETVNVANVKAKLDRLAATGVPVYISELDLNIADDNTQKNKMQELFPVLYEHSAVKGVTLWGYLQGHTWISNSYLIRSDGSERPALTWLKQYLSGTPTQTPPPSGSYKRLRNVTTGLYIDGMGSTANGSNACQWGNSNSNNQQWTIETSGGYVMFKNRATGLYLDGMGRTSNGSICGQWGYSNSTNQQWTQETAGSNVKFKNRATGLYLDGMGSTGNGSNLCQWSGGSSTNQQWQIQ